MLFRSAEWFFTTPHVFHVRGCTPHIKTPSMTGETPMPGRTRSYTTTTDKGYTGRFGGTVGGGQAYKGNHHCADVTGPGDNAPLYVRHHEYSGGRINKPNVGFYSSWFSNYQADLLDNSSEFDHLGIAEVPSETIAATTAAARTNPSRPYVDVPANLLEIGDLAHIIQRRIDPEMSLTRALGRDHLRRVFGIQPVYNDLQKLLRFQDQVDRRVQELEVLRSRGLRKTVSIGSFSANVKQSRVVQSYNTFIVGEFDVTTTTSMKVHCRWFPTEDGYRELAIPRNLWSLAHRSVLGVTVDASTLWEPMPWSWLIDWATNCGDYFKATRNIVGAGLGDISVMTHSITTASWPGYSDGDVSCTAIESHREDKRRQNAFVAPVAHFPFLSGSQMGIIAALAVSR